MENGRVRGERKGKGIEQEGREEEGTPKVGSHPNVRNLKNNLIAELICLAGAATQTFAPGGKHPRAATGLFSQSHLEDMQAGYGCAKLCKELSTNNDK